MIDDRTVNAIREATNIYDVVSDFIALKRSGVNYVGLCPFHTERNPSFYVSPERNICKCFSCGEGGDAIEFLKKSEGMNFVEALQYLANKYGIEIEEKELSKEEIANKTELEGLFTALRFALQFFQEELHKSQEGQAIAMSYLKERGLSEEVINKFSIGYSPAQRDALLKKASQENQNLENFYKSGLCFEPLEGKSGGDRFYERVLFPIISLSGRVVAFGGRTMKTDTKFAKYINSPESLVYSKSKELFGIHLAKRPIQKADKCYLVEGYLDVISLHQFGIENVVAPCGTALTEQQIVLLKRFSKNITLIFDGDPAGLKATERSVNLLLEAGMNIKIVLLPEGEDPDTFVRKNPIEEVQSFFDENEMDFVSFKVMINKNNLQRDLAKKAELIKELIHSVALIPDNIERSVYTQGIAQHLSINEVTLLKQIQSERRNYLSFKEAQRLKRAQQTSQNRFSFIETREKLFKRTQLFPAEKDLLFLLIRYGDTRLPVSNENGEILELSIAQYILESIETNEDKTQSLFSFIIQETIEQLKLDENFSPQKFFPSHANKEVVQLALNFLIDNYQLSEASKKSLRLNEKNNDRTESDIRNILITSITSYHYFINEQNLSKYLQLLKEAEDKGSEEEIEQYSIKIAELNEIKKNLNSALNR